MARVLIVAGGCRGRCLAAALVRDGHALRVTTRMESGRAAIEAVGAECWVGTPGRLATLRGALEGVTIACWLLGSCSGDEEELRALHTSRLELFLTQAVDTTVRGFLYEARGSRTPAEALAAGEGVVRRISERNAIPVRCLTAAPSEGDAWLEQARAAIGSLLGGR